MKGFLFTRNLTLNTGVHAKPALYAMFVTSWPDLKTWPNFCAHAQLRRYWVKFKNFHRNGNLQRRLLRAIIPTLAELAQKWVYLGKCILELNGKVWLQMTMTSWVYTYQSIQSTIVLQKMKNIFMWKLSLKIMNFWPPHFWKNVGSLFTKSSSLCFPGFSLVTLEEIY